MIFKGTEKLSGFPGAKRGIPTYGSIKVPGYETFKVYRAAPSAEAALQRCGWWRIGSGQHYIYVTRHERKTA